MNSRALNSLVHATGLLIMAALVSTAGCTGFSGSQTVHGSGNVISEQRPVIGFDRVDVAGAGELTMLQGDEEGLTIETDDNLLPFIQSEVHNGCLSIGVRNASLHPSRKIVYRLKLRNLSHLDVSGAMKAQADSLRAESLEVGISGAGQVNFSHLEARVLKTDISGAGDISASGRTETQIIKISGAGKHHAPDLKSAVAEAHVSGAGDVQVWVTDSLTAHISGSGSVKYRGKPGVNSHIFGTGQVTQAGE